LTFGDKLVKEMGEFALYQNRPNPMLNSTAIGFNLPKEGEATFTIYNIEGKAMKVVNSTFKAGYNEVMVEKETFQTSGVYYYRLETSEHSATKKMVVSF
jgi:Secretion system C-terminal sorting domain